MSFGDYAKFDLIGEQHVELTFSAHQQSKFKLDKLVSDDYLQFRSETIVNVAGSAWYS